MLEKGTKVKINSPDSCFHGLVGTIQHPMFHGKLYRVKTEWDIDNLYQDGTPFGVEEIEVIEN